MKWETVTEALKRVPFGASGVYAVKEAGLLGQVLYVGESHTGRLRKTFLRHFQRWKGQGHGPTFPKKCLVSVLKTSAKNAVEIQNAWIDELRPKVNKAGTPDFWS